MRPGAQKSKGRGARRIRPGAQNSKKGGRPGYSPRAPRAAQRRKTSSTQAGTTSPAGP